MNRPHTVPTWHNKTFISQREAVMKRQNFRGGAHLHKHRRRHLGTRNTTSDSQRRKLMSHGGDAVVFNVSHYANNNSFRVSQVFSKNESTVVQIRYSTGKSVVPIFMMPHHGIAVLESLWETFQTVNNPCLLNNGVTTLCCVSELVKRYHISHKYVQVSKWLCPGGVASTAATIAIPVFHESTSDYETPGDAITQAKSLFEGVPSTGSPSWVQLGSHNTLDGLHDVQLILPDDFVIKHSLVQEWDMETQVHRFFVGVTFSELQVTSTLHNSAALSVITLFRNISSGQVSATLVTENAISSIQDVHTVISTRTINGNTYFFATIRVVTDHTMGISDLLLHPDTIRYAVGLKDIGVREHIVSAHGEDSWDKPCTYADVLADASLLDVNELCSPLYGNHTMEVTVPIGVNLFHDMPAASGFVLHIKMKTENSILTVQVPIDTSSTRRHTHDMQSIVASDLSGRQFALRAGITDMGFHESYPMHPIPLPVVWNDPSFVVSGSVWCIKQEDTDHKHSILGMATPGVTVEDLYVFEFAPGSDSLSTVDAERFLLAAVAAGVKLQMALASLRLFTPTSYPYAQLKLDISLANSLCDRSLSSAAPCTWSNPIIQETISETDLNRIHLHDGTQNSTELTKEWLVDQLERDTKVLLVAPGHPDYVAPIYDEHWEDSAIVNKFMHQQTQRTLFLHPDPTVETAQTTRDNIPVLVVVVALLRPIQ
jgi:hypothetical protein